MYNKLKQKYKDPTYGVVAGHLSPVRIWETLPKSTCLYSRNGLPSVKANLKAVRVQGDLFLLERYVFFVSKPPTPVELFDFHQVVSRLGVSMGVTAARTFDVKIAQKRGRLHVQEH